MYRAIVAATVLYVLMYVCVFQVLHNADKSCSYLKSALY